MKLAFLYAGQGTQSVGMGRDLYEQYPAFRKVMDSPAAGCDLKKLCFEGPDEVLAQTRWTQPCVVAVEVGITALLYAEGIRPQMAAGLSLGEYSALCAAGVFDVPTVLSVVAYRGRAMQEASEGLFCGMTAVLGLSREPLLAACREASALGTVEVTNYNCPGQMVISGEMEAVKKAGELALKAGAKRCVPLKLSGPFHSSMMAPAGRALAELFPSVSFGEMQFPVIFNATGKPKQPGETIPKLLEKQVQSGVLFEDTIRYMEQAGIDTALEIGPGKVLSGFVRRTARSIKTYSVENADGLREVIRTLKGDGA